MVQGKMNLKFGLIIIKSYPQHFDEIPADLSNSFGTSKTKIKISPSVSISISETASLLHIRN